MVRRKSVSDEAMQPETDDTPVVLIHGLWMNGLDQIVLARRLRARGYCCVYFRYPTVRPAPAALEEIRAAFRAAGIAIARPQRDVHIRPAGADDARNPPDGAAGA